MTDETQNNAAIAGAYCLSNFPMDGNFGGFFPPFQASQLYRDETKKIPFTNFFYFNRYSVFFLNSLIPIPLVTEIGDAMQKK